MSSNASLQIIPLSKKNYFLTVQGDRHTLFCLFIIILIASPNITKQHTEDPIQMKSDFKSLAALRGNTMGQLVETFAMKKRPLQSHICSCFKLISL